MNASYREFSHSGNKEDLIRREMGCITFQRGKDTAADRRMEVCIPSIIATADGLEHTVEWVPTNDEDTMSSWFARIRFKGAQNILYRERMMCMHNRKWSLENLDFGKFAIVPILVQRKTSSWLFRDLKINSCE